MSGQRGKRFVVVEVHLLYTVDCYCLLRLSVCVVVEVHLLYTVVHCTLLYTVHCYCYCSYD